MEESGLTFVTTAAIFGWSDVAALAFWKTAALVALAAVVMAAVAVAALRSRRGRWVLLLVLLPVYVVIGVVLAVAFDLL